MKKAGKNFKDLKFHIHTFGCQMNENDSERIAGILKACGARTSNVLEESDLVIVNTCAVRKKSEEKLYSYLGRLASLKEKKKIMIGVVGCVAQLYKSELLEKRPFIDFVLGPDNYNQLREVILSIDQEKFISTCESRKFKETPHHLLSRQSTISSYVTIMEGCNNFCSYCIVPFVRGREKFRPMKNIVEEVQYLADKGYKEIQLLGQNVNSYQDPESGKDFSELLRKVNRIEGIEWIRFITSHPKNFGEKIATTMKESKKICHQLHLPLQSGSTSVLKRMNRGYTREEYLEKISILRNLMPDISLSTDIIVGFPGETEEEFQDTLTILREIRYANIFSFRYSPRPLTASSEEKDTIPFEEKKRRLILVQQLQKELQLELNKSLVGRVMRVLCLGKSKKETSLFSGRNEGYQVVNFKSKNDAIGRFIDIRITSFGPYSLIGEEIQ